MFIIDPITLKKVNLRTENGLLILKNYVKYFQNGGSEGPDLTRAPGLIRIPPTDSPAGSESKVDSPDDEQEVKNSIKNDFLKDSEKDEFNVRKSRLSGTLTFIAPEALADRTVPLESYSLKPDIWSLGIVFLKLLTGFEFYIILDKINNPKYNHENEEDKQEVLKQAKEQINFKGNLLYLGVLIKETNIKNSIDYLDLFSNEHKKYLNKNNFNKLKQIFELIKRMIKFNPEDRIDINDVFSELKRITNINTEDITIPFDGNKSNEIKGRVQNKVFFKEVHDYFDGVLDAQPVVFKFGNDDENNEILDLKHVKRKKCTSENSCIIAKREEEKNINEVFLHRYLSEKDTENKHIIDFYTYDSHEDDLFIYMEHIPQSLQEYWKMNLIVRDLSKYYKESQKPNTTHKPTQVAPQKEVSQQQMEKETLAPCLYELYKKQQTGIELGGEKCSNTETNKLCKLHGNTSGQGITCKLYGTKHKCKTSNEELAKKVKQERDNKIFEEIFIIILKSAEALQFFHQNNILHGDIKPGNIVIQKKEIGNENKYSVKFIDVGESNILRNNQIYKLEKEEEEEEEEDKDKDMYDMSDSMFMG